ncbi:MAG: succinyldiaminopimelate transaminase [Acidimicrobiia bacterium]
MTRSFVPPPYPQDRLGTLRRLAEALPGGIVDVSVGQPVDPMPEVVLAAFAAAAPNAAGYPVAIGSGAFREAASEWMQRRFGVTSAPNDIVACIGTKEAVASLPHMLHLRNPDRDTVLYPAVSYPTYEMGALLAGLRAVPVPVDDQWRLDLSQITEADAQRALMLWCNEPANPTGSAASTAELQRMVEWARAHGIVVASDECYVEFTYDAQGDPAAPTTALSAGPEGVLVVHSLSKRSNMAGMRAGFVAGDAQLVGYLAEVRRHAGLMVPSPVQAAAAAALNDDDHVALQRARYAERRRALLPALEAFGLVHDGGSSAFYLWLRDVEGTDDGWEIAARLAEAGLLCAPGDLYGVRGADHVRVSLTATDEQIALTIERLAAVGDRR